MDINEAKTMFANMGTAAVQGTRELIQEGRYLVLMNSIQNEKTRKLQNLTAMKTTVVVPLYDSAGRTPDSDAFEGSPAGSHLEWASFFNDYYASNMKSIIVTCLGMSEAELKSMEQEMTSDQINSEFFDYMLHATGSEVKDGNVVRTKDGVFDNSVVIEVNVKHNMPIPKEGEKAKKPYVNVYPVKKIPLMDLVDKLGEDGIIRFFGSLENFETLAAADA